MVVRKREDVAPSLAVLHSRPQGEGATGGDGEGGGWVWFCLVLGALGLLLGMGAADEEDETGGPGGAHDAPDGLVVAKRAGPLPGEADLLAGGEPGGVGAAGLEDLHLELPDGGAVLGGDLYGLVAGKELRGLLKVPEHVVEERLLGRQELQRGDGRPRDA